MTLAEKMKEVLDHLRTLPVSRERALAMTKLEECAFWSSAAAQNISSPIDWVMGEESATPRGLITARRKS